MQASVSTYKHTNPAVFYGENFCGERQLSWDEENRLRSICDNGYVSSYFYDAGGERTVKLHGSGEGIHVNSAFSGGYTNNVDYTLYVDAYMVLEKGGQYTKHIYIGDQRIVSKLGDVGSFGVDPRREQYAGEDVAGVEVPNYKTKYEALQNVIKDNYQLFEVDYYGIDNDNYVDGEGFCCEPKAQAKNARSLPTENVDYEKLQYYYHSDHLGSASYITNLDGEVVQHIEYVPFGEVFLEERNNTWNTPFLFNGKELDEETGLYYYGARYYNPRISLWYGVDPLFDKYPAHSPYCYTMNNPVMLIDPDGRKIVDADGNTIYTRNDGWAEDAPEDAVRLGNAMMGTRSGNAQFNEMVDADYGITLNISQDTRVSESNGRTSYRLGEASKSVSYDRATGNYDVNSVDITVFEGTLNEFLKNGDSSLADTYRMSTENNDQAIGAIGVHEAFHATDPQNIRESIENHKIGTSHDVERGPRGVELNVLSEQYMQNLKPLEPIRPELKSPQINLTIESE